MGFLHIHFALAGDGEQFKSVSKNAQSLANLSVLGWLDRFEIVDLLKLSHIGLVPCISVLDAMPNKPFEYLSAGLPILSSLQGEMEAIIGDHNIGYSYKSGDLDTFVKLVVKLASEERLRVLQSYNADKLFRSKFSSKIIYKAYADHVEEIAREK
jgi:glycosyltransferase involved in cell wall biosynthesis